ncbi:MAG: 50S ribosomal protein L6 [Lentisphaerae bacterium]|nr:50S ribosomal protein L6 [Lentisphaerota bacterium]
MSRIGKQPIAIPAGVAVSVAGGTVRAKGPKGELALELPPQTAARVKDGAQIVIESRGEDDRAASFHGLARSLVANMVKGVSQGYRRDLEMEGVGFRAALRGTRLEMTLGFSSPVVFEVPEGITVAVEGGTAIAVTGADKQRVGDTAARIRSFFPAEPYKGKGLRYKGERVRRKVGKTVA